MLQNILQNDRIKPVRVINLSSGSDGNLTYIESATTKILVDAGLSCKEIELRLSLLGVGGSEIAGILVTHEHSDHIKGIDVFATKFGTRVYAHEDEWNALSSKLKKVPQTQKRSFTCAPFEIGDLTISAFKVPHDSACCVGFNIENQGRHVSICTDLGAISDSILENIYGSELVFLEANHDVKMLQNNINYSASLKQRILSSRGHLSNIASANAILKLARKGTRRVVLSHLSKENNNPTLAYETIKSILESEGTYVGENFNIDVASTMPGKIYKIS